MTPPYGLLSAESLQGKLREFECRYGMLSAEFYDRYLYGGVPGSVNSFDRVVWADAYREACRLVLAATALTVEPSSRGTGGPSA
jgi:hypothetical protein